MIQNVSRITIVDTYLEVAQVPRRAELVFCKANGKWYTKGSNNWVESAEMQPKYPNLRDVPAGASGEAVWGTITGDIASQTDLSTSLAGKAATGHSHANYALTTHDHNGTYAPLNHSHEGGSITYLTDTALGDVNIVNATTWYDSGADVTLTVGTWMVTSHITMGRANTTAIRYTARITDGTNTFASSQQYCPSVNPHYCNIAMSAIITVGTNTVIKVQGRATTGGCLIKATSPDGAVGGATQITALKVG